jgi:tetratricopeptide (TPR) repeat protein
MKPRPLLISILPFLVLVACTRTPSSHTTQNGSSPATAPGAQAPSPASAPMAGMPAAPATLDDWARGAQLFDGLGTHHRKISTSSAEAQQYFDQGMRLMWAFNHDESSRSFAKAAQLDRGCAICLWGVALTVGPNYNMPMMAQSRAKIAYESVERANDLLASASPEERALINALRARYPHPTPLDPSNLQPVLSAYANEMRIVAERFPRDSDIQTMYAESMMNINAWKLWSRAGDPAPNTQLIVATLETVLARDPDHPGANHYYIHAMEASTQPQKALKSAERLGAMMPAAGHLVHMPSHIMQRVGRYSDAAEANRKAAAADAAYLSRTQPLDYYSMYVAHNFQFLAYATAMEGRKAETLEAMKRVRAVFPEDAMLAMPGTDWYGTEPLMALVRFGMWDEILAEPRPNPALSSLTGGYLFARATALAARNRVAEANQTIAELDTLRESLPADTPAALNLARDVLALASKVAKSRVQCADGQQAAAIDTLKEGVELEDRLSYDEPADWFFPVRHLLGAELIQAGRAREAEAVYREDLRRNPENGWALFGLVQALRAEGHAQEAGQVEVRFKKAWQKADVSLTASAM